MLLVVPDAEVVVIVAFSFGNRIGADGLIEPGPINRQLAVAATKANAMTGATVVAQWEIARILLGQPLPPAEIIHSIDPVSRPDGTVHYLNTAGVARAVAELLAAPAGGAVAVVAHTDHAARCGDELGRRSLRAGVLAGVELPTGYDPLSGQPWTRSPSRYLAHEARVRPAPS